MAGDWRPGRRGGGSAGACWIAAALVLASWLGAGAGGGVAAADEAKPAMGWTEGPRLVHGVFNARASVVPRADGGAPRVAVVGGFGALGAATSSVQVLDVEARVWRVVAELETPRAWHAQLVLGPDRLLVAGGTTGSLLGKSSATASVELVDLEAGRVVALPTLPGGLAHATAHRLNERHAVIIGGRRASVLDLRTGRWLRHIRLRRPRQHHVSAVLADGRIAVVGGEGERSIEIVDPVEGVSQLQRLQLPEPLDDASMLRLPAGGLLLLGGQSPEGTTTLSWRIDLLADRPTLRPGPTIPVRGGLSDASLVIDGEEAWLLGGETDQNAGDIERDVAMRIDLAAERLELIPRLPTTHDDAAAVVTAEHVIVMGGFAMKSLPASGMGSGGSAGSIPTAQRAVSMLKRRPEPRPID